MSLLIKSRVRIVELYLESEYIEEVLELEIREKIKRFKNPPIF